MKIILIIATSLAVIVGLVFVFSSPDSSSNTNITISTINDDVSVGSLLLDVRTPEEYADGYIESATNLPLDDIKAGKTPDVDKSKTLYVYCKSGNRSAQAVALLKNAGYTNVQDLGGINEVAALGGQVIN